MFFSQNPNISLVGGLDGSCLSAQQVGGRTDRVHPGGPLSFVLQVNGPAYRVSVADVGNKLKVMYAQGWNWAAALPCQQRKAEPLLTMPDDRPTAIPAPPRDERTASLATPASCSPQPSCQVPLLAISPRFKWREEQIQRDSESKGNVSCNLTQNVLLISSMAFSKFVLWGGPLFGGKGACSEFGVGGS